MTLTLVRRGLALGVGVAPLLLFIGCAPSEPPAATATGSLEIRANGEDFVRQGFVSKDGWSIEFEHVHVTLSEVTAYQTEPAFDPLADAPLVATAAAAIATPQTIDLAAGAAEAEPILVDTLTVPTGHYNALTWTMIPAPTGAAAGAVIQLEGTATKAGQTVAFKLRLTDSLQFECGEFIGAERRGIVTATAPATVEATFHFDHLFGDAAAPVDEEINTGALGFEPLAAIATANTLNIDSAGLKTQLTAADYQRLIDLLPSLGHVGEGHCRETQLSS